LGVAVLRRFERAILFSILALTLVVAQRMKVQAAAASPAIHQGDLIIAGNDVYVVANERLDINGNIIVEENATLILTNATLNFTQTARGEFNMTFRNPLNGNPHLLASESKVTSGFGMDVNFLANSTADVSQLEAEPVFVRANDLSSLLVSDSRVTTVISYGASAVVVMDSELGDVVSRESSFIEASGCNISFVSIQEDSHVSLSNCTVVEDLSASEATVVELSDSTLGGVHVTGSCNVTFLNRLSINGSIMVSGNATLIMRNALINLTQTEDWEHEMSFRIGHHTGSNPRLYAENATLTSAYAFAVSFFDNSSGLADQLNCSWPAFLFAYDSSVLSMSSSTMYSLQAWNTSTVEVFNCTTRYMDTFGNSSVSFRLSTASELRPSGLSTVDVSDSEVSWRLQATGFSFVNFSDSWIDRVDAYDSSIIRLAGSTYSSCFAYGESDIYIFWHLDIHVVDQMYQDVSYAIATALYPNATLAGSESADVNGWARLTLMEKRMNATGEYPTGNYTVEASYLAYSNSTTVNLTENQMLTLKLEPLVIPELPSILLSSLLLGATLLAAWAHNRKWLVTS
jgi:hypothetical protein